MKPDDRVEKRGLGHKGTITRVSDAGWISVRWDEGPAPGIRPRLCKAGELVAVEEDRP